MKEKNRILLYPFILGVLVLMLASNCKKEDKPASIAIGNSYQGGIIAYILQPGDPGYDANVKHGLIVAPTDQGFVPWGCFQTIIGGTSTAFGKGQANTTLIVTRCSDSGIAAKLCNDLVVGGYSDWYLPSKDELNKLYLSKGAIGGFASDIYWSSSEYDGTYAWVQAFYSGGQGGNVKSGTLYVRAIRSF